MPCRNVTVCFAERLPFLARRPGGPELPGDRTLWGGLSCAARLLRLHLAHVKPQRGDGEAQRCERSVTEPAAGRAGAHCSPLLPGHSTQPCSVPASWEREGQEHMGGGGPAQ